MQDRVAFFSAATVNEPDKIEASIRRVLRRQLFVLCEEVSSFEREFAEYCQVPYCVGVANGTDALELALRASEVGPGDEVILTANAGFYGSTAVRLIGARPSYVDVERTTLNMSPDALEAQLNQSQPKAILVTHLYGQLAQIEAIAALAQKFGVSLIEDCAQAHGARRAERLAGSFGDVACFSFYPTKNLGAVGDGGAVLCKDEMTAKRLFSLRQYGWRMKYENELAYGRNSRLDEIQAAVLRDKLPSLDRANSERRTIARELHAGLSGLPLTLNSSLDEDYVAHLYVIRTPSRDALRNFLVERGVACDVHYPIPDHHQPVLKLAPISRPSLEVTEAACSTVLSLPCYPGMPPRHMSRVIEAVKEFFGRAC